MTSVSDCWALPYDASNVIKARQYFVGDEVDEVRIVFVSKLCQMPPETPANTVSY
jgi:hypothetical protein